MLAAESLDMLATPERERGFLKIPMYQLDFLVSFFGFFIVRYCAVQLALVQSIQPKVGLVIAFFYALFNFLRNQLLALADPE
tara:strand:+ start:476 stop:721 length:246 start_codon:yes stop_codon:yes gene_type:complete